MPIMISINGSDLEPMKPGPIPPNSWDQTSKVKASSKVTPISLKEKGETFEQVLKHTKAKRFEQILHSLEKQHKESRPTYVKDLMTSPAITVTEDTLFQEVQSQLVKGGFRHLPVVNGAGKISGMVSDRDLLKVKFDKNLKDIQVKSFMSTDVIAGTSDALLFEVIQTFLNKKINALPVIDEDQQPIGIMTTSDVLKSLLLRAPLELWI